MIVCRVVWYQHCTINSQLRIKKGKNVILQKDVVNKQTSNTNNFNVNTTVNQPIDEIDSDAITIYQLYNKNKFNIVLKHFMLQFEESMLIDMIA